MQNKERIWIKFAYFVTSQFNPESSCTKTVNGMVTLSPCYGYMITIIKYRQNKEISLIKYVFNCHISHLYRTVVYQDCKKWHSYHIPILWVYDNHHKIEADLRGKVSWKRCRMKRISLIKFIYTVTSQFVLENSCTETTIAWLPYPHIVGIW